MRLIHLALAACLALLTVADPARAQDPYLWLEEVESEKALAWVEARNAATVAALEEVPELEEIYAANRRIYDSDRRIPAVAIRAGRLYNFWQDAAHERGIWRRTSFASYRRQQPEWETLLDIDALARDEAEPWVWKGATCLEPDARHCMLALSRGGGDAVVHREFDTSQRSFVENGFALAEAKSSVSWRDADTLWVGTDFGEGSLTTSGCARTRAPCRAHVSAFSGTEPIQPHRP